ncbi:MAG: MraY family glycosyltransferase [Patescibacteria group bacterium]|nr:MraY family glycosyltransferase [Patescibacteria group bacterium]
MPFFLLAAAISFIVALVVRRLAVKWQILDLPDNNRKKHHSPVPLFGGLAVFLAFWMAVVILFSSVRFPHTHLSVSSLIGVFIGSVILIVVGLLDDKYRLRPAVRLIASALAIVAVVVGGVRLTAITNPFGGAVPLDGWMIGDFAVLANTVVFFWLMGMMYATKIFDGLDGLTAGVVGIGAMMIYFLTHNTKFYQPDIALIALILAGACLGFLILNFHPAKIFLGEGGGLFLGFILGVLAIIAGGKIATALLVMAIPVLDLCRVIYLRLKTGQPIFEGDRRHLHYQLLDYGLGHRQTVLILYGFALIFGLTTLFLPSRFKLLILFLLAVGMFIFGLCFSPKENKR